MIHSYGYKPSPEFRLMNHENPATTRTFGLELEVSTKRRVAHTTPEELSNRIDDIFEGFVYCKSDSSISDGVELVTHPASLRTHMSAISWKWICKTCVKAGFRSHDADQSAGLHIHVGRQQLGLSGADRDETIRKIVVLVRRHWPQLVNFSRRELNRLNDWSPCPGIPNYRPDMSGAEIAESMSGWDTLPLGHNRRYTAVNLTNVATIEFRLFRGSLKRDTVIAAIQLVDNFCEYAMAHTWDEVQSSEWLDVARCKVYNELDQYLVKRRLMPPDLPGLSPARRRCDFSGTDGCLDGSAI